MIGSAHEAPRRSFFITSTTTSRGTRFQSPFLTAPPLFAPKMDLLLDVPNHQQFEVFSAAGLQASPSTARGALEPLGSQFPIAPPPAAFSALPCRTCTADQSGSVIMLFLWSLFGSSHRGRANETDQRHCAPHFHSAASARHIPMTSNLSRQGVNKPMIPWRIHS